MGSPCSVPRLQAPPHWLTGPLGHVLRVRSTLRRPLSLGLCILLYLPGLLQILEISLIMGFASSLTLKRLRYITCQRDHGVSMFVPQGRGFRTLT